MARGDFDQMAKALGRSGLKQDHVKELIDVVSQFQGVGRRMKAFPKGQFGPDSIEIQTVFERDGLESLMQLLGESGRIDSVEIFPRGIVDPEAFSARIRLR